MHIIPLVTQFCSASTFDRGAPGYRLDRAISALLAFIYSTCIPDHHGLCGARYADLVRNQPTGVTISITNRLNRSTRFHHRTIASEKYNHSHMPSKTWLPLRWCDPIQQRYTGNQRDPEHDPHGLIQHIPRFPPRPHHPPFFISQSIPFVLIQPILVGHTIVIFVFIVRISAGPTTIGLTSAFTPAFS